MTTNDPWHRRARALLLILSGIGVAACAGENLFTVSVAGAEGGPDVDVTTPAAGLTVALGAPVGVAASVNAPNNAVSYTMWGRYPADGTDAYNSVTGSLNGTVLTVIDTLTAAAGQVTGDVYIVVEVLDQTGEVGLDSIKISVIN